jgi:hypothetical protein
MTTTFRLEAFEVGDYEMDGDHDDGCAGDAVQSRHHPASPAG